MHILFQCFDVFNSMYKKSFLYTVYQNTHTYEVVHGNYRMQLLPAGLVYKKEAYNVYRHGLHWVFRLYCVKGNTLMVTVIIMHNRVTRKSVSECEV